MNKYQKTVETYNKNAAAFVKKFEGISRVADVVETFALVKKKNPKVLEVGCGYGREAMTIVAKTNDYTGIDVSTEFIKMAASNVPDGRFVVADIRSFKIPRGTDIVFAFASLLHVNKTDFRKILGNIFKQLNPQGVVRISLKCSEKYEALFKKDQYGERAFYFYSPEDIRRLAKGFLILKNEVMEVRGEMWLETILQKP